LNSTVYLCYDLNEGRLVIKFYHTLVSTDPCLVSFMCTMLSLNTN